MSRFSMRNLEKTIRILLIQLWVDGEKDSNIAINGSLPAQLALLPLSS